MAVGQPGHFPDTGAVQGKAAADLGYFRHNIICLYNLVPVPQHDIEGGQKCGFDFILCKMGRGAMLTPVFFVIAAVRKVSVREKFLRFLFGDKTRLTVIVPGDTVQELEIREIGKEAARETV